MKDLANCFSSWHSFRAWIPAPEWSRLHAKRAKLAEEFQDEIGALLEFAVHIAATRQYPDLFGGPEVMRLRRRQVIVVIWRVAAAVEALVSAAKLDSSPEDFQVRQTELNLAMSAFRRELEEGL